MNEFYYKIGDLKSFSIEKCSSETPIKTIKVNESQSSEENDIVLNKIQYQPLILEADKTSKLKESWEQEVHMQMKYGVIIETLKIIDWNQQIIQLPNLCLTKIDKDRFKFDPNTRLITMINRKNIVDECVSFIQNQDLLYLYGLKGIGKSFIIYQMVAKLMAMDEKY